MSTPVDFATWPRREHYNFFKDMSWPFFSLTFPVDVTRLRAWAKVQGVSFYYSMVWAVTKAMERTPAFLYKDRGEAGIVKHSTLVPSFTDLTPGSELFHITTVDAGDDMADFARRARAISRAQTEFINEGGWEPDSLVYFTCLPWFPISALTNERHVDPADSIPRMAWGKWREGPDGSLLLDISLEANHRLMDGVNVGQFHAALTAILEGL